MTDRRFFFLLDWMYSRIFGYSMGVRAQEFLKNLGIVAVGVLIVGLSSVFTIFAGRALGPEEYGKANLVFTLANFFIVPMGSSISVATIRYVAQEKDKGDIISSSLLLTLVIATMGGGVLYFLDSFLSELLRVELELIDLAVLSAYIMVLASLTHGIFKGLKRFKTLTFFSIFASLTFIVILSLFTWIFGYRKFDSLVWANICRGGIAGSVFIFFCFKYFRKVDFAWLKQISSYSFIFTVSAIPGIVLMSINPLLIYYFLGIKEVGIYSAYFLASTFFVYRGLDIFLSVFFPEVSSRKGLSDLSKNLQRFLRYFAFPTFLVLILIIFLTLVLLGNAYPSDFLLIIVFAVFTVLYMGQFMLGWLINVDSLAGPKFAAFHNWIAMIISVLIGVILIPLFGLSGAVTSSSVGLFYLFIVFSRYLHKLAAS